MLQGRHRTALVEWAEEQVVTQTATLLCLTRMMRGAGEGEEGSEGERGGGQSGFTLASPHASLASARRLIAEYSGMTVGRRLCMFVAFVDEIDHHIKWKDRGSRTRK